jgi:hypothetical protein
MRIGLYSGTTLYPLAGAAGVSERTHSGAAEFSLTAESARQIAAYVRGEYAKPIDRGNLLNGVSFSTSRQLATPAEAFLWCLDYETDFARSGDLVFEAIAPDGSSTWRRMRNTLVDPPVRRCNGATALVDYRVQGGVIEPFTPNAIVSGVSTAGVNGTLIPAGIYTGKPAWSTNGTLTAGAGNTILRYVIASWEISVSTTYWANKVSPDLPFGLTGWAVSTGTGQPIINVGLPA